MRKRKKELLGFGNQEAQDKLIQLAAEDRPTFSHWSKEAFYRYALYLSTKVDGDWMAVFLFQADSLRLGGRKPRYIVFLDRKEKDFITYDLLYGKWREATLEKLVPVAYKFCDQIFVPKEEEQMLKTFFDSDKSGAWPVYNFQMGVRKAQLEQRHRRETDPWDQDLKEVNEAYPKDWKSWLGRYAVRQQFIFYQYKKNVREGYCSWCRKWVPVSEPRHNKMGRCQKCGSKIQYKATGRAGSFATEPDIAYLLQRCGERVVLRQFQVRVFYRPEEYLKPVIACWEKVRLLLDEQMKEHVYEYDIYKNQTLRWIRINVDGKAVRHWYETPGAVYRRTLPALNRTFMKKTGFYEMAQDRRIFDAINYLSYQSEHPYLERLVKAGLLPFAEELVKSNTLLEIGEHGELGKCLKIDRQLLKRMRRMGGGIDCLQWLQMEKRQGKKISDDTIGWFLKQKITPSSVSFVSDRMSAVQISNYLKRQEKEMKKGCRQVLETWKDYLSMEGKLGMDVSDPIVYRTGKLQKRHNEAVCLLEKKNLEEEAEKMSRRYPKVSEVYREIRDKYEYLEDEKYAVIVPTNLYEVMEEGRTLHHCVGNQERYYDRINRQESYILFLRRKDNLKQAFYTLEVEPGGTIRQKRKEYDRQGKEIEELTLFLKKWQTVVRKRLAPMDEILEKKSRELRMEEFDRMKKEKIVIYGGDYAGKMLADVLGKDLIEISPEAPGKAA